MFQESYSRYIEQAVPDKALTDHVLRLGNLPEKKSKGVLRAVKRPAIAAIALLCFLIGGVPALAAGIPIIYDLMYLVSPPTAQFFMPVQKASEDNGIRMEVVATYIHEDTAEIYVTLQDLEGERVDATTDLYDSYSINRPFDSAGYCERVGYDEDTRTATFLITITEWGGQDIAGDKITFTVRRLLSDKSRYEDLPLELDLSGVGKAPDARQVTNFSGGGMNSEIFEQEFASVLGSSNLSLSPVEDFEIVGAGYIDGKLHVQMVINNSLQKDNHAYLYLMDSNGAAVETEYTIDFFEQEDENNPGSRVDYCNYIFNVPAAEIGGYKLYGSFYTSGNLTEGNWRVTFPLGGYPLPEEELYEEWKNTSMSEYIGTQEWFDYNQSLKGWIPDNYVPDYVPGMDTKWKAPFSSEFASVCTVKSEDASAGIMGFRAFFAAGERQEIRAVADGVVIEVMDRYFDHAEDPYELAMMGLDHHIVVQYDEHIAVRYIHFAPESYIVEVGQSVAAGDVLGKVHGSYRYYGEDDANNGEYAPFWCIVDVLIDGVLADPTEFFEEGLLTDDPDNKAYREYMSDK